MKRDTILIGRPAYMFLRNEMQRQRGLKPLSEAHQEKVWGKLDKTDGKYQASESSFDWPLDTLKRMLAAAGFAYEDEPAEEYMRVY